eukprot:TRINITY_DN10303_c0_g1_i1.p1 TRINITY_DN10303_c0_g1~~TRINITY_DN10303_c0_g1_i1.p1  ORF type:complete len:499 (+),score=60.99 TRINITY_DN10303_c0_g1_i1:43-1539(+)
MKSYQLFPLLAAGCLCSDVTVDWQSGVQTNSHATYQTSINPKYRMDTLEGTSNISKTVFANMKALQADYMRHVPWFPYPRLAVAELYEPHMNGTCTTYWNFTYMDPITNALMESTSGHPMVAGFATSPEWMWQSGVQVPPVNIRDVPYEQGMQLRDQSFKEITGYYTRLASYYTKGGFTDECGAWHKGYNYTFEWWEVFNEPSYEHGLSPQYYDQLYDAIVTELVKIMPGTKFIGLAKGTHNQLDYYTHHLNRSNHNPSNIPLDGISYHQYVIGSSDTLDDMAEIYFPAMDTFVNEVATIEGIKQAYSPSTQTFINEIGCASSSIFVEGYYMLCAANFAYLFAKASPLQVEHFGMSQVIGFTGKSLCSNCTDEWPSTSMVDWYTGNGNARYWTLKVLIDAFPYGTKTAHNTYVSPLVQNVTAQAFTVGSVRKLLLVSTADSDSVLYLPSSSYSVVYVDQTTGDSFSCTSGCYGELPNTPTTTPFTLRGFGVAVFTLTF